MNTKEIEQGGPFTVQWGAGHFEKFESFALALSRHRVLSRSGQTVRIYGDSVDCDGDSEGSWLVSDGLTEAQREAIEGDTCTQVIGSVGVAADGSMWDACSDCGGDIPHGSSCEVCSMPRQAPQYVVMDGEHGCRVGGTFKSSLRATNAAEKLNREYGSYRYYSVPK